MQEDDGRLKEYREMTVHAAKDYDRIVQQIKNLKEVSKQDSKTFESILKDLVLASEKKKQTLEAQMGLREKKSGYDGHATDASKALVEANPGFSTTMTLKNYNPEDRNVSKLSTEAQKRQEEDFRKLVAATGINDVSELVDSFMLMEEENFRDFRCINEINFEIIELENQIAGLRTDRDQLAERVTQNETEQTTNQQQLEAEKQTQVEQREKVERFNEETEGKLRDILKEVCNVFYIIGADNLMEKTVLKNDFMRIENLPEIFKAIESRFLEMIFAYSTIIANVGSPEEPDERGQGTKGSPNRRKSRQKAERNDQQ